MEKKTIAIVFGGCSSEYDVSLKSAYSVISNIDQDRYRLVMVGITREGQWLHFCGTPEQICDDSWMHTAQPAILSPDRTHHGLLVISGEQAGQVIRLDAVFPVLHGKNGEDGTIQGLVELAGIPLVGCDTLGSAIGMDKDIAHRLAEAEGIRVPCAVVLERRGDRQQAIARAEAVGMPLFVKPLRAGSSMGIAKVEDREALEGAVQQAFAHDDTVIIEECIPGFEVGCAVLGTDQLTVGEIDEIELSHGFFDYVEKYNLNTASIHMPARVERELSDRVKQAACRIYRALKLKGFARVDLFATPEGVLVFNEVNTIPGFTSASRYPSMLQGVGISYSQIIDRLIQDALDR